MELILIVLPVFLIFGLGFFGQKKIGFDIKNLTKMYIYLMAPILAFRTFYQNPLSLDYLYLLLYIIILLAIIVLLVKVIGWFGKYTESQMCGMILASAFANSGNYGVPVALFAFGTIGLDYAVILMILQSLINNTVGIYYAARGSSKNQGMKKALLAVTKMPILYGAVAGVVWEQFSIPMPSSIFGSVDLVADAAIPLLMIILGMQLASITMESIPYQKVSISLFLKMILSPAIAIGIVFLLPVDGVLQKIMILMAAMPTAAFVTMLSLQFETEPNLVTSTTFISTLTSIVTIPIVLSFLV